MNRSDRCDRVQAEQGWTDETLLGLALEFLAESGHQDAFDEFLEERARSENEESRAAGVEKKVKRRTREYAYRYTDQAGKPLTVCPGCGGDLTAEHGVDVVLSDGNNHVWEVPDRLDKDGCLEDAGGQVAQGLHSATDCGYCAEQLIDLPGVVEYDADGDGFCVGGAGAAEDEEEDDVGPQ